MGQVTIGDHNDRRYRATLDLPSVGPFSGYVSFVHEQRDGDIRNLGAGVVWDRTGPNTNAGVAASPEWLGSKDANSVFAAIHFKPDNNFSTIYKFDYVLNHCTPEANVAIGINTGTSTGQLLAALVNTSPNPQVLSPGTSRPAAVNNDFVTPGYQKNFDHSLTSTLHDLDRVSIKNIASYRPSYINASSQIDGLGGLVMTPQALRHRSHCPLLGASARCGRGGATTPSRLRARLGRR